MFRRLGVEVSMIRSMTGFGSETQIKNGKSMTVEIRSLNHRYCEITMRLPKKLYFLENKVKNQLKNKLLRGKLEVFVQYQNAEGEATNISYNRPLAQKYLSELLKMSQELYLENDLSISKFLTLPELFLSEEETEADEFLEEFVAEVTEAAADKVIVARALEGSILQDDIFHKLAEIHSQISLLPALEKRSVELYRQRLTDRLNELLQGEAVEQSRIITETAIMADRLAVDEEIVRLSGHTVHLEDVLKEGGAVGKKLDFIVQEMNREVNTIASKSIDMEMKNIAIGLKTSIEKIREQIQNIE